MVVPLPELTGLWQKEWVEQERKRKEYPMVGGPVAEGKIGRSAVVRQVSMHEVRNAESEDRITPVMSTPTLQPGEVREIVTVANERGDVDGWVETKRTADGMEETITLGPSSRLKRRQATESSDPRARASQRDNALPPGPTVASANGDDEEIPGSGEDSEIEHRRRWGRRL